MKKSVLIFIGLVLFLNVSLLSKEITDSLFTELDKAIENRANYFQIKKNRIKSLTDILKSSSKLNSTKQDSIYNELFREYSSFNYDSAFTYSLLILKNAYSSNNKILINKSRINVGFSLLSAGLFKETLDTLGKVSLKGFTDSLKLEYYSLLARTYFDMADYTGDSYYAPLYNKKGMQMLDSALILCPDSSKTFLSQSGLRYLRNGEVKKARQCYEKLLMMPGLDYHQYAIEASSLSYIYGLDDEPELAIQMLIKAAIADIMASTKETVAIRQLAEIVFNRNEINKAYNYVRIALDDANFYGAKHRKIQVSDILPYIEDRQLDIVQKQRKTFLVYSLSITILSILVILFGVIIFRQLRLLKKSKKYLSETNESLSEINRRLVEANLIKEEYIGHFLNTISEFIIRIEELKLSINRKIMTHRVDDIKDIISAIDIKKERELFYHNFDSIFLKIFPNFIESFNSFLKEERLKPNSEQLLTPEVRIYALIRIGISDNDKIAKFLGYSLNTIYTYKTKIKNWLSIPVDEFDKRLMEIKAL